MGPLARPARFEAAPLPLKSSGALLNEDDNWVVTLSWDDDVELGTATGSPTLNGVAALLVDPHEFYLDVIFPPTAIPTYNWVWEPHDLVCKTPENAPLAVLPTGSAFYSAGGFHCTGVALGGGPTELVFSFSVAGAFTDLLAAESEGDNPLSKGTNGLTIATQWLALGTGADVYLVPDYVVTLATGLPLNGPYHFVVPA